MKKLLAALIISALSSALFAAAPIATYTPDKQSGISIVQPADGICETVTLDGKKAVKVKAGTNPVSNYIYFRMSDEVRAEAKGKTYLIVEFYEERVAQVRVQYSAPGNPYADGGGFVSVGSKKFSRILLELPDDDFTGAQNDGGDFRFEFAMPVAALEVYKEKPDSGYTDNKDRLKDFLSSKGAAKPEGMYYTFGNDCPESVAPLYKALGVTSVESYVTWETVERAAEGKWDWSAWDRQVKILRDNDLKWVPFIILGPAYSVPDWFRKGPEHVSCYCLDHNEDGLIESLWNPNLRPRVERFLKAFAEHYKDDMDVIESLLFGIEGNFGEAIYPVLGGGWTFSIPGEHHTHPGFWCGDKYAEADFPRFLRDKYGVVQSLNRAWKTDYAKFEDIKLPRGQEEINNLRYNSDTMRPWLDFSEWYIGSMTELADYWLSTARKIFPKTEMYLCTGGHEPVEHGSDFGAQCKAAAKYKAGVRITNEASDYATNFYLTRHVASAGKFYGAYFGFEPAGPEDERGIVARIYNAAASGANQLHDYNNNITNAERTMDIQRDHIKYLKKSEPVVNVAVWYPSANMRVKGSRSLSALHYAVTKLRDYTDFDEIDDNMIADGALDKYKMLVIVEGNIMEDATCDRIVKWMSRGGTLISYDGGDLVNTEYKNTPEMKIFGSWRQSNTVGKGKAVRVAGYGKMAAEIAKVLTANNMTVIDLKPDDVYTTEVEPGRFLILSRSEFDEDVIVTCNGETRNIHAPAMEITEYKF